MYQPDWVPHSQFFFVLCLAVVLCDILLLQKMHLWWGARSLLICPLRDSVLNAVSSYTDLGKWRYRFFSTTIDLTSHVLLACFPVPTMISFMSALCQTGQLLVTPSIKISLYLYRCLARLVAAVVCGCHSWIWWLIVFLGSLYSTFCCCENLRKGGFLVSSSWNPESYVQSVWWFHQQGPIFNFRGVIKVNSNHFTSSGRPWTSQASDSKGRFLMPKAEEVSARQSWFPNGIISFIHINVYLHLWKIMKEIWL